MRLLPIWAQSPLCGATFPWTTHFCHRPPARQRMHPTPEQLWLPARPVTQPGDQEPESDPRGLSGGLFGDFGGIHAEEFGAVVALGFPVLPPAATTEEGVQGYHSWVVLVGQRSWVIWVPFLVL